MRKILWIGALATLLASGAYAQDISGDWQGTIERGGQKFRGILRVTKGDDGAWHGMVIPIDPATDWGAGVPVTSMTLQGSALKFTVASNQGVYEGTVSADGMSITGTWKQGQEPAQPLNYQRSTNDTAWKDPSPHAVQFVTVEKDVKLEILDWGGTGRPLVLLAGLGNTAHVFDKFAPKLTPTYHVYGITRRGFGASSAPAPGNENYSADRLGDDILAVIDALKLNRPVLVGHSIGGEELSSVGSRHPEEVAGLIYLDAGYAYAYYNRSRGDLNIDSHALQSELRQLEPPGLPDARPLVQELLETGLPNFERDVRDFQKTLQATPPALFAANAAQAAAPAPPIPVAVIAGEKKYITIAVPILAIFADPHALGPVPGNDAALRAWLEARDAATTEEQVKAFESGLPSARVVRLPHANHYVFQSNEADVLREMNAFLTSLH